MRVESMVAQQAVLSQAARRTRLSAADRPAAAPADSRAMGAGLPAAVADRLASLFAADPGLAAAVSANMPAARQTSASDLAAYGATSGAGGRARLLDTVG